MKGFSIRKIGNVAATEYVKWICNPRISIFLCMFVFVYDYVIKELAKASVDVGSKCGITETFLAVSNSPLLVLVMPAVFIALIGDFPKTDGNTMFYIQRTGKQNWLFGQLVFIIYAAFTFMAAVFAGSVLFSLPFSEVNQKWSDVVTKYVYLFPDRVQSLVANLITGRMYNNVTPSKALFLTFTLVFLYLVLLGMILMTGFAIGKRVVGIGINCTIMCIGSGMMGMGLLAQWLFPSANAISWTHFDPIMKQQIFEIKYSYLYFIGLIVVLFIFDLIAIGRYDFAKITDMED
jgi:hypothetical protein